jgi:hypothetical protein
MATCSESALVWEESDSSMRTGNGPGTTHQTDLQASRHASIFSAQGRKNRAGEYGAGEQVKEESGIDAHLWLDKALTCGLLFT